MVAVIITLIIAATVLRIAHQAEYGIRITLTKRIIVPEPTVTAPTTPNSGYIKEENHQHTELLKAMNDILSDFNGGSDAQFEE